MSLEQYLKPVTGQRANICWDCGRNIAECPWLHEGKPVEGWTAKKVTRKFGRDGGSSGRRRTRSPIARFMRSRGGAYDYRFADDSRGL